MEQRKTAKHSSANEWYLEPLDAQSNERIAKFLECGEDLISVLNAINRKDPVKAWGCSWMAAQKFWRSRVSAGVRCNVWGRSKNYGPVRLLNFLMRKSCEGKKPRAVVRRGKVAVKI